MRVGIEPRGRGWVIFVALAQAGALLLGRLVDRPRLDLADLGMVLVVCVAFLPYSLSEAKRDRLASFRPRSQRDE